jgi:hypothetical protein
VLTPVIDFDAGQCYTRVDIKMRTTLQAPCIVDELGRGADLCQLLSDSFSFKLANLSLSILPEPQPPRHSGRQQFTFGLENIVHAILDSSVMLANMGSAHHVHVFAAQSSHTLSLQWCGSAALRITVQAQLLASDAANAHSSLLAIQSKSFVVVHLPEEACANFGEQKCYDAGSDSGCFWCQRARRCVHSSTSINDAAVKCKALPEPAVPPRPGRYSSIQCTIGIQTWPPVRPLSNRNRICMMRDVCIVDSQLTLFLPPSLKTEAFADSLSSVHVRGIAHYDGWSSLTSMHRDVEYLDGDSSGFIPRVKHTAYFSLLSELNFFRCCFVDLDRPLTHIQVMNSSIPSDYVIADDADVHLLQRHSG